MMSSSAPLVRLGEGTWVRGGCGTVAVRFVAAVGTQRSELEVEVSTGTVYRVYGAEAEKAFAALQEGTLGL